MNQEHMALAIVALVGARLAFRIFWHYLALPLSKWLLKRGKVKWAMRIRHGLIASSRSCDRH